MQSAGAKKYDVCVYGGTSAGVVAAYSAAKCGLKVAVVEPGTRFGGLTAGGLGLTDIGNKQVVKGVAKQFYRKVGEHYGKLEQWIFEPSVADSIMRSYLRDPRITVMPGKRIVSATCKNGRIAAITLEESAAPHAKSKVQARYFIDCSYEGDLMARAGVTYTVGREPNDQYGETYNGVELMTRHQFPDGIDPYIVKGDPSSGLLWGISSGQLAPDGTGDGMVQAYNYRICLTDREENRIPIDRPAEYDSTRYELLLRLMEAQPGKRVLNDYFIWSKMPGGKTDINNRGGFSTDMIGMNHAYPEATYGQRDSILGAHISYTKGLLYFVGHDQRVPDTLRSQMLMWGYPKDEYVENGHWTPQIYARECRRMVGEYVATQADCQGKAVPDDGIAMAAYQMDSHNCQRIVVHKDGKDMVKNEGNVEIGGGLPYPISYRSITPVRSECTNLLVPVCMSASHIAYGSIRMEPVFMVLGQASAIACSLAVKDGMADVQDVDSREICAVFDTDPFLNGSQPDVLVDDSDPGVYCSGTWRRINKAGGYGLSFMQTDEKTDGTVNFTASVPTSGSYKIYTYQTVKPTFSSTVDVAVTISDKRHDIVIPRSDIKVEGQTTTTWVELGEYELSDSDEIVVSISAADADAPARADAVLLVKVDPRSSRIGQRSGRGL